MYKKPAPTTSTSPQKSKKEQKSRKTDDKSPKKAKDDKESTKSPAKVSPAKSINQPMEKISVEKSAEKAPVEQSRPDRMTVITRTSSPLDPSPLKLLPRSSIIETRPNDGTPSSIMFRISYGKDTTIRTCYNTPSTSNTINANPCTNCQHYLGAATLNDSIATNVSADKLVIGGNNREEFLKYLGIDTKPSQEKVSPEPSPTDANSLYNQRRSLRVFIQQRQYEFTKGCEKPAKEEKTPEKRHLKSPSLMKAGGSNEITSNAHFCQQRTPENGKKCANVDEISPLSNGTMKTSISNYVMQRRSYEPPSQTDPNRPTESCSLSNGISSNAHKQTEMECVASASAAQAINTEAENNSNRLGESSGTTTAQDKPVPRVQKRKIILPSPMMLTEMFKRYKQCFKQGFAMRQQMRHQATRRPKKRPNNTVATSKPSAGQTSQQPNGTSAEKKADDIQTAVTTCEDLMHTFSPTSITHSNASSDSAIVVNLNGIEPCPPAITLTSADSLQWQQDRTKHINKSQFRNPLDPKNGTVIAVLTHTTAPEMDDVVIVIQESLVSYWYSTAKVLSMFGVARSWLQIGQIQRFNNGKED